jgi:hypothetical protein
MYGKMRHRATDNQFVQPVRDENYNLIANVYGTSQEECERNATDLLQGRFQRVPFAKKKG